MSRQTGLQSTRIWFIVVVFLVTTSACGLRQEAPTPTPPSPPSGNQAPVVGVPATFTAPPPVDESPIFTPPPPDAQSSEPGEATTPIGAIGSVDVVITGVSVNNAETPGKVYASIGVSNQGSGTPTSSFTVRWYPHAKSDVVGCSWDLEAYQIPPTHVAATLQCVYTYEGTGNMQYLTVVDADKDISETDESNNTATGEINIQKPGQPQGMVPAPANCTFKMVDTSTASIEWTVAYPLIDGFCIYRDDGSQIECIGKEKRSYNVNIFKEAGTLFFDVRSYIGSLKSPPNLCVATPQTQ